MENKIEKLKEKILEKIEINLSKEEIPAKDLEIYSYILNIEKTDFSAMYHDMIDVFKKDKTDFSAAYHDIADTFKKEKSGEEE